MIRKQKEGRKAPLPGVSHGFRSALRGALGAAQRFSGTSPRPRGPRPVALQRGEGLGLLVAPG